MIDEVNTACTILLQLAPKLPQEQADIARQTIAAAMIAKYTGHWGTRGSAYRSLHHTRARPDPVIAQACNKVPTLAAMLPADLYLWVDPHEVSYRIGSDGSVATVAVAKPQRNHDELIHASEFVPSNSPPRSPKAFSAVQQANLHTLA